MSKLYHEEQESCQQAYFLLVTWNMFTIGQIVSAGDNDKVKAGGKDYVNVKLV